tara:strand:+ start:5261 stop:5596 length:336 start_codon:yes stop_codon:yes gene_type:complete
MKYFDEHICMINSYKLLTGRATYDELLEDDANPPAFIFNPTKPVVSMEDDVYDVLIEYFVEQEDYEKCSELRDHKRLNSYYSLSAPLVTYKSGMPAFRSHGNQLGKNTSNP